MNIPTGHQTVMPYLMIRGVENFISFTQRVFNAELLMKHLREDNKTVMHAEVLIGNSTIMCCEAQGEWKPSPANLFVYLANADETAALALQQGGTIVKEVADQDYGRSGGVDDGYGNTWWITSIK